jgi:hypothetical protein
MTTHASECDPVILCVVQHVQQAAVRYAKIPRCHDTRRTLEEKKSRTRGPGLQF